MDKIDSFREEHGFLSNFHPAQIMFGGKLWPSSEHLYMAMKTIYPEMREKVRQCSTPGRAKRLGRKLVLRDGWGSMRHDFMYMIVRAKFFQNEDLLKLLLATGDAELVEGNHWHDNFWGDCRCPKCRDTVGQNHLGKILMQIRDDFAQKETV